MTLNAELVSKAMQLTADERAELARQLILSLEPAEADTDAEQAWDAEIERRLEAIDGGTARLTDWRESIERARAAIRKANPQ
jgi:putative addiction module component (TIGR02574 family)